MTPDQLKMLQDTSFIVQALLNSGTFPIEVINAISARINFIQGTGSAAGSALTQNVVVSSTPTTIVVPAQPSGTIPVIYKGTTYNLLYK